MVYWRRVLLQSYTSEASQAEDGGAAHFARQLSDYWAFLLTVSGLFAGFIFAATLQVPDFRTRRPELEETGKYSSVFAAEDRESMYGSFVNLSFGFALGSCVICLVLSSLFAMTGTLRARKLAEKVLHMEVLDFLLIPKRLIEHMDKDGGRNPASAYVDVSEVDEDEDGLPKPNALNGTEDTAWARSRARTAGSTVAAADSDGRISREPCTMASDAPPEQTVVGRPGEWSGWYVRWDLVTDEDVKQMKEIVIIAYPRGWRWYTCQHALFDIPLILLFWALLFMMGAVGMTVGGLFTDTVTNLVYTCAALLITLLIWILLTIPRVMVSLFFEDNLGESKTELDYDPDASRQHGQQTNPEYPLEQAGHMFAKRLASRLELALSFRVNVLKKQPESALVGSSSTLAATLSARRNSTTSLPSAGDADMRAARPPRQSRLNKYGACFDRVNLAPLFSQGMVVHKIERGITPLSAQELHNALNVYKLPSTSDASATARRDSASSSTAARVQASRATTAEAARPNRVSPGPASASLRPRESSGRTPDSPAQPQSGPVPVLPPAERVAEADFEEPVIENLK